MEIKVKLEVLESENSNGVKLWVTACDGSHRRWFRWYENKRSAYEDASNMRLAKTELMPLGSSNFIQPIRRTLLTDITVDESVLEKWWVSALDQANTL